MSCELVEKTMPLYVYGELAPETEEALEEHMAQCGSCRVELARHREFALAAQAHELDPSPDLLMQCRQALAVQLQDLPERPSVGIWRRIFGFPDRQFPDPGGRDGSLRGWDGSLRELFIVPILFQPCGPFSPI